MFRRSTPAAWRRRSRAGWLAGVLLAAATLPVAAAPDGGSPDGGTTGSQGIAFIVQAAVGHLVLSEVATGGSSASDEFVELYNPGPVASPVDGLELVYVTASGATVTRKASWAAGAAMVPPGGHLLIANEAGLFAAIADLTYANGLAASGGSLALRIVGASTAIDAVGWGSAGNAWMEGSAAPAPAAGHSIERLPGGGQGSTQDTDQNAIDFAEREVPDPQNSASPPVPAATPAPSPSGQATPSPSGTPGEPEPTLDPSGSAPPTPTASATSSAGPTASPTPTPPPSASPAPLSVAEARALPEGSEATIEAVALTDAAFSEGGGYVADATGGIAVLVSDGTFARGALLRVSGVVDDRYHQRTLRAVASGLTVVGSAADPAPVPVESGEVGEPLEGQLVTLSGAIVSSATELSGGVAFDLDDGSGPVRVLVGDVTAIDTAGWERGTSVALHGVVGQRDSTGTGSSGYRVQPRDAVDILSLAPPPSSTATPVPTSSPGATQSPSATPAASPSPGSQPPLVSISAARQSSSGTRVRVRGVVTLPSGLTEPGSAVIQDASGAILVRLGEETAALARGELVELSGTRSTKAGMLSLRVSVPPLPLGRQAEPAAQRFATGRLGEEQEALLVVVRGAVSGNVQRTSAGNTYLDLDDGSGPIRIFLSPRASVRTAGMVAGAWLEVVGVLGQDTTSQQPARGYRVWPRGAADVTTLAQPVAGASSAIGGRAVAGAARGFGAPAPVGGVPLDLPAPELARPVPTASPAPKLVARSPAAASGQDGGPPVGIAGLALGGLLLLGGGALGIGPGTLQRLRARVRPADAGEPPASASPEPDLVARLAPLTVLEGRGDGPGAEDAARPNSGRILPPI